MSRYDQKWRWDDSKHLRPTVATIVVAEPTEAALAERQRKIDEGAVVVPFGFARALGDLEPPRPPALDRMDVLDPPDAPAHDARCPEVCCGHVASPPEMPLMWEGDQA